MFSSMFCHRQQVWVVIATYLFILVLAMPVLSATPAELLEKGIYTEETVGDLDKAIEVYEKVLDASKDSINAAAEAQFRIGTCYAKQGKTEEAEEAFEAVVDNYPDATEWVAQAKGQLPHTPELLPVPWGNGDELQMEMKLPTGLVIGMQVFRIGKIEKEGRSYWESANWQSVSLNNVNGVSCVLADLESFAPIKSEWNHTLLGDAKAVYEKEKAVIRFTNQKNPKIIEYLSPVFDNEQGAQLFRRLPLKVGSTVKVDILPILTATKIPLTLKTTGKETIEVPAGKFECFRLFIEDLNQVFWISNDKHRYIVRFEVGGVKADLTSIRKFKANQTTELKHERFSATLPTGWYGYSRDDSNKDKKTAFLVAPNPHVTCRIHTAPVEKIRKKHETSHAWLESGLSDNHEDMDDYALGDKGIQATTIGGLEAAQADYTFTANGKSMKARRILCYGKTAAFDIRFATKTEDFEGLQGDIEKIMAAVQVK